VKVDWVECGMEFPAANSTRVKLRRSISPG
jgi:hypothetical protein